MAPDAAATAAYLAFAGELADAAGAVIRPYFRAAVPVDHKADASPVTIADRDAEQAMRSLIEARFPDHGIEGEEFGTVRGEARLRWCLDPIDGTRSFITGRPLFGTLISLVDDGRPLLGIIDHCMLGERWSGARGLASQWNGQPARVRPCAALAAAALSTTSPEAFTAGAERDRFTRLAAAVQLTIYGGDCYAYGLLAMGHLDLVVEANLQTHDYMALVPVVEGAGGVMTDWQGRPLHAGSDGRVIAAGDARVHQAAVAQLAAA